MILYTLVYLFHAVLSSDIFDRSTLHHGFAEWSVDQEFVNKYIQKQNYHHHNDGFMIPTEVKDSTIAGFARFAKSFIPKGTVIRENMPMKNYIRLTCEEDICRWNLHTDAGTRILSEFAWSPQVDFGDANDVIVSFPGFYVNHDPQRQNVQDKVVSDPVHGDKLCLVAIKDIPEGCELYDNYSEYADRPWFDQYMTKRGTASLNEFGKTFDNDAAEESKKFESYERTSIREKDMGNRLLTSALSTSSDSERSTNESTESL